MLRAFSFPPMVRTDTVLDGRSLASYVVVTERTSVVPPPERTPVTTVEVGLPAKSYEIAVVFTLKQSFQILFFI